MPPSKRTRSSKGAPDFTSHVADTEGGTGPKNLLGAAVNQLGGPMIMPLYKMKDLGLAIGIDIQSPNGRIKLSQRRYIEKILERFWNDGLQRCQIVNEEGPPIASEPANNNIVDETEIQPTDDANNLSAAYTCFHCEDTFPSNNRLHKHIHVFIRGLLDGKAVLLKFPIEANITEDLSANMLIGTDVLDPHKILLDIFNARQSRGRARMPLFHYEYAPYDPPASV